VAIDSYTSLLSKTHYVKVHPVYSGWVSQQLFHVKKNKPLLFGNRFESA
jgi:hypothetical protein